MEFEDWGPVIAHAECTHFNDREAIAKALSVALIGDSIDWKQHLSNADRFIKAMNTSIPKIPLIFS